MGINAAMKLALLLAPAAAAAQVPAPAQVKLEEAGRHFSTADRMAQGGDRKAAIAFGYRALKAAEEARAAGAPADQVDPGLRMIQADLGDWLLAEKKWDEARTLFRQMAGASSGALTDYFHIRALKGLITADAAAGDVGAARASLGQLIATGRAMLAKEPHNAFLTRQLAEFLEADTFLRYWSSDSEPAMRAAAMETLGLFRAVAAANPDSAEAKRAQFVWAWRNARITNEVPLWKEAAETGQWLEDRRELKKYGAELAEARRKLAAYERKGMINLSD
jgi:hypothetical protein